METQPAVLAQNESKLFDLELEIGVERSVAGPMAFSGPSATPQEKRAAA